MPVWKTLETWREKTKKNAYKINNSVSFVRKTEDPLDAVIEILDEDIEHKKTTHPYVPPQAQSAPTIELETQAIDNEFAKLIEQFDRVGNIAAEQKKQKQTAELVDDIIKDRNPFQNVEIEDIWIENDLFDKDPKSVIDVSKKILDEISSDPRIDLNIATPPNTDDEINDDGNNINVTPSSFYHITPEIDDDIDFTITDCQLVEGNDINVDRDTEPFVDFTITDSRTVDSDEVEDIDFTITDSQLVEGNDNRVNRETEPFVDFTITDSRTVDSDNEVEDIDFTITDSQLLEGNDNRVNRETEPFVDFTITNLRLVDSDEVMETIVVMMDDDIVIPNTNVIGKNTGPPQRKRIVTSHQLKLFE